MAEIVGIVGSVVGILSAADVAYQKLKTIKGLPEAFAEVALRVPLAQQILRDVEARSRETSDEAAKAILPIIKSCKGNAETLKTTLEKLDPGEFTLAWNQHVDRYISLIKSRGKKGRVEDLMKKILQDIYILASHRSINAASSEQLDSLKEAINNFGQAKESVPDELVEDDARMNISHGGQGPMLNQVGDYNTTWNNFGSGNINNISGDAHFGATADERKRGILRDLNCASYEDHKNRNPVAAPETCGWFTKHPTYQGWMTNPRERFLWVSADPGCGKSVLAKHMIDHQLKTSKVIYFFFKDGFDDQDNVESALKCLLHQLLKGGSSLFTQEVVMSFEELGKKRSTTFSSLWNIFANVSTNAVDTICIMDALDECEASGWSKMAKALGDLCEDGKMSMRFILFSRPYNQVRRSIRRGRIPHISLRGEDEVEIGKISAEINLVIRQKVEALVLEYKLSFEEHEKVVQRLTKVRNRTYLWIHVICDMLETLERVENDSLERFLERLPETVEDAYDKILRQSVDVQAARTLLHIIVAAARPLSVKEMAMAMAVNGHQSFEGEFSVMRTDAFIEGMRNICGLFVVVVQENVHLIHQTAREFLIREVSHGRFLKWEACLSLRESNEIVMRLCVWYLLNIGFRCAPLTRLEDIIPSDYYAQKHAMRDYAQKHVMFDYASRYWVSHYRQSKLEENSDLGRDVFQLCDTNWSGCMTWYTYSHMHDDWNNKDSLYIKLSLTPLQFASDLGIEHAVRWILVESKYELHPKDGCELGSPLELAARSGCHDVVLMLLKTRVRRRIYQKRLNIGPALSTASAHGHTSIVETLLKAGWTKVRQKDARSALFNAATMGYDPVVSLLLSSKMFPGTWKRSWHEITQSWPLIGHDYTALGQAAFMGHPTTVKIILESGKLKPDPKEWNGQTPFSTAVSLEKADIANMLLKTGKVDINSRDKKGLTPFIHAALEGNVDIVKMLLNTGQVNINSRDKTGTTPLMWAITYGHANVVKLLLDTGQVDLNSRNNLQETPLFLAIEYGRLGIVKILLATGKVDTSARNMSDETPLAVAVRNSHPDVVNWLLSINNIRGNQLNLEVVSLAAMNDDLSIVKLLHEKWNAELGMSGSVILDGSPIIVALEHGSTKVFGYLLDAGQLDVNCEFEFTRGPLAGDMCLSTLLIRAVERGPLDIVRTLLSRKADVNLKSSTDGATALSTAVERGRLDAVVTLLQEEGLDLTLRCQNGLTTRLIARRRYDCCRRSREAHISGEIILWLNDYIRSMPDGGEALLNLERSIIENEDIEVGNLGVSEDSD